MSSSKKTKSKEFGRKEIVLGPETLVSSRSTHSSHNTKNSKSMSIFSKNGSTKGFATSYIHAPFCRAEIDDPVKHTGFGSIWGPCGLNQEIVIFCLVAHTFFTPCPPFKFLSSANEVSTGPTCQFLCVCLSVCLSFRSFFQGV